MELALAQQDPWRVSKFQHVAHRAPPGKKALTSAPSPSSCLLAQRYFSGPEVHSLWPGLGHVQQEALGSLRWPI